MATRTATAKKVNRFYMKYAEKEMLIDMDDQGLYCDVPSECEEGKCHRVHVDESTVVPVAVHCSCIGYDKTGSCKHQVIVNNFYARIYKSNLEKVLAKFEEQEVGESVPPIAMELPAELQGYRKKAVSVDISTKGNLNGAQQSAGLLSILPSRKAKAS